MVKITFAMQPTQVCKNIMSVLLWKILLSRTSCTASHVVLINSPHYHHRHVLVYRKKNQGSNVQYKTNGSEWYLLK